jgi:hypothetical protein
MYPLQAKSWNIPGRDIISLHQRLIKDSPRLFEPNEVSFDILSISEDLESQCGNQAYELLS